ncbi:MAG: PhoU domain-containing protein [Peptoniphilaceae bacterium]|nr:hypothetical protein [Peptoniphilaceae bacterium]MDD7383425.1 PhoU domain-containing protein [Peptoniphilaceae bacterium]MDY3738820.1 PhoU domain-containing protein [Peptoniphilaceae bacterium]
MMRKRFDNSLKNIRGNLVKVGEYCVSVLEQYESYTENSDENILREIADNEDFVYRQIDNINADILTLMLTQQPVAGDLRFLQSSIEIANSLKKIYSHITESVLILINLKLSKKLGNTLNEFLSILSEMLKKSNDAYLNLNKSIANEVITEDEKVDSLFAKTVDEIVFETNEKNITAMQLADLVLLFKYFERIGDRCERICKSTIEI